MSGISADESLVSDQCCICSGRLSGHERPLDNVGQHPFRTALRTPHLTRDPNSRSAPRRLLIGLSGRSVMSALPSLQALQRVRQ